jgi:hypothetical protein
MISTLLLSAAFSFAAMQPAATADLTENSRANAEASTRPDPTVDTAYAMVDCLMSESRNRMEDVLGTIPGSRNVLAPWITAETHRCTPTDETIEATTFYSRGAIAERLLLRDFSGVGASRRHPVRLFSPVSAYYLRNADHYSRVTLSMLDMAGCVARAEPEKSFAFFHTQRGSAAERQAMAGLAPTIGTCLPQGESFELTAALFRAFLAEATYRVAAGRPDVFASN